MLNVTNSWLHTSLYTVLLKLFSMAWIVLRRCNTCSGKPSVPPPEAAALAIAPPSPPSRQTAADTTRPDSTALSGCLVDAGLMLGQTCRVCWAPNGTLVIPGQDSNSPILYSAWDMQFAANVAIQSTLLMCMCLLGHVVKHQ